MNDWFPLCLPTAVVEYFHCVASYGALGHVPSPRLSTITFFSWVRSRTKSITAITVWIQPAFLGCPDTTTHTVAVSLWGRDTTLHPIDASQSRRPGSCPLPRAKSWLRHWVLTNYRLSSAYWLQTCDIKLGTCESFFCVRMESRIESAVRFDFESNFRIESAVYTTQAVTPSNELQGAPCRRTV